MLHTANIDPGVVSIEITFNCSVPANSVTQTYGPGNHTDPDNCASSFVSATINGIEIPIGDHVILPIGLKTFRVDVSGTDGGRHITVDVLSTAVVP